MAQFYAAIKGNRGQATRMGTKASGLWAHVRGWHIGCRVELSHIDGHDYVTIFLTHGSANPGNAQCIGRFRISSHDATVFRKIPSSYWRIRSYLGTI
jgi:hypothetical protein